jgi:hypothetical protein
MRFCLKPFELLLKNKEKTTISKLEQLKSSIKTCYDLMKKRVYEQLRSCKNKQTIDIVSKLFVLFLFDQNVEFTDDKEVDLIDVSVGSIVKTIDSQTTWKITEKFVKEACFTFIVDNNLISEKEKLIFTNEFKKILDKKNFELHEKSKNYSEIINIGNHFEDLIFSILCNEFNNNNISDIFKKLEITIHEKLPKNENFYFKNILSEKIIVESFGKIEKF